MRLIRRTLRANRSDGEAMGEYLHGANGILLSNCNTNHETWDLYATQLRFDWDVHVARLQKLDPTRLTFRVCSHWNYNAIRHVADQHAGRQNHGRHLHIWRWEYYMYKQPGKGVFLWQLLAGAGGRHVWPKNKASITVTFGQM